MYFIFFFEIFTIALCVWIHLTLHFVGQNVRHIGKLQMYFVATLPISFGYFV
jgi:hypothetical protein